MRRPLTFAERLLPIACNHLMGVTLGIVGVKITTRVVAPVEYGSYALFLTLTQLGYLLTHAGLVNHTARYWQREQSRARVYARFLWQQSWRQAGYLAPILVLVALALVGAGWPAVWVEILPFLLVANLAVALGSIANSTLNAQERNWLVLLVGTAASLRTLVPAAVYWVTATTVFALCTGFAVYAVLLTGVILIVFRWAWGAVPDPGPARHRWRAELRDYGRPFVIMGIGAWLLLSVDRWIVAVFFGDEKAGLFAMAANLGAIIPNLIAGGLLQLVFPGIFRLADAARTARDWRDLARRCDQVTLVFFGLSVAGLSLLALVGPALVPGLIDRKYAPAMRLLFPAGMAMGAAQANQFQYLLLQGRHNSRGMVRVMGVLAGLKTLVAILLAYCSWTAFVWWLILVMPLSIVIGRLMIQGLALSKAGDPGSV